jgi:hypothetical protein
MTAPPHGRTTRAPRSALHAARLEETRLDLHGRRSHGAPIAVKEAAGSRRTGARLLGLVHRRRRAPFTACGTRAARAAPNRPTSTPPAPAAASRAREHLRGHLVEARAVGVGAQPSTAPRGHPPGAARWSAKTPKEAVFPVDPGRAGGGSKRPDNLACRLLYRDATPRDSDEGHPGDSNSPEAADTRSREREPRPKETSP